MLRFKKEQLSIHQIGNQRFWFGLISGILFALVLFLILSYFREFTRMFSAENSDLVIFDSYEFRFYDYFYAILSSVLGLSTSIWLNIIEMSKKLIVELNIND